MARITAQDILRARDLLRKWRDSAKRNGKDEAVKEIEHVMRVLAALYSEGL